MKNISILGSTGSIGTQALDVIRDIGNINVVAMSTNKNIDLLENQIREFNPKLVCVVNEEKALILKNNIKDLDTKVVSLETGLIDVATYKDTDILMNSVVGNVGLLPTIEAIRAGKDIALANKETLVSAGEFVMREAKNNRVNIIPVDSEHSAIFQCLQGNYNNDISKIILTASGGPFRSFESLENVTPEMALKHPNWSMGSKITIDSATLMNKGLEVIEAKWLFDLPLDKINVLVHKQSIIHSMVEYEDGSIIAQMGTPDMKLPIQYALTYPYRLKNSFERLDLIKHNNLTFEKPNTKLFKCLDLAFKSIQIGGTMPAVLNASNEVLVESFLNNKIKFNDIPSLIEKAMNAYNYNYDYDYNLNDVILADSWAREYIKSILDEVI